ncbi:hypothetical protein AB4Z54_63825, partial [Streptomyces sp. MCAF7]
MVSTVPRRVGRGFPRERGRAPPRGGGRGYGAQGTMVDVSTSPAALAALAPLTRAVTYTRWLHLLMGAVVAAVCGLVYPGLFDLRPADMLWLP